LYESYFRNFFKTLPDKYKPKDRDFEQEVDLIGDVLKAGKKLNALRKMKKDKIKEGIADAFETSLKDKTH
jgi:hypothetical protein